MRRLALLLLLPVVSSMEDYSVDDSTQALKETEGTLLERLQESRLAGRRSHHDESSEIYHQQRSLRPKGDCGQDPK